MLLVHPDRPGRAVRLAYCMNFAEAVEVEELFDGLRTTALPLRERIGVAGPFGIGLWLPADLAMALTVDGGEADLDRLLEFLAENGLDAFTFNAFPWGGFLEPGLKSRVFRPTWKAPERLAYTSAVARIAAAAWAACGERSGGHVSISTHAGMHASAVESPEDLLDCADNLALAALLLAQLEDETGLRVVLSLEPEPRSIANDTRDLPVLLERVRARAGAVLARGFVQVRDAAEQLIDRHLGACLDACHSAVEFEEPAAALARATSAGSPLGKLQVTNALRLPAPSRNEAGRERLLAMDEPVFLHQLTARGGDGLLRAGDLPEVREAWDSGAPGWRESDEWRCHFHVPVDLDRLEDGLATTRDHADALVAAALDAPDRWGSDELHLEIETYTWSVLPPSARGAGGSLLDAQEREYRHVLAVLARAGWSPA